MNEPQLPTPNPYDPPPWQRMPPNPAPNGNRRLIPMLLGLVCVLAAIVVALTVTVMRRDQHESPQSSPTSSADGSHDRTSAPAAAADRLVPVTALDGLLPDRGVVSSAVTDPAIDLVDHGDYIDNDEIVDVDCQGLIAVASRDYTGSGWTAIRSQRWDSPAEPNPPNLTNEVLLSVATYPQADAARAFYAKQSDTWSKCSGHIVNTRLAGATESADRFWGVGRVTDADGVLAAAVLDKGNHEWLCQNRLTARNNVVVRVEACGCVEACGKGDSATAAQAILDSITSKIDAAG